MTNQNSKAFNLICHRMCIYSTHTYMYACVSVSVSERAVIVFYHENKRNFFSVQAAAVAVLTANCNHLSARAPAHTRIKSVNRRPIKKYWKWLKCKNKTPSFIMAIQFYLSSDRIVRSKTVLSSILSIWPWWYHRQQIYIIIPFCMWCVFIPFCCDWFFLKEEKKQ